MPVGLCSKCGNPIPQDKVLCAKCNRLETRSNWIVWAFIGFVLGIAFYAFVIA